MADSDFKISTVQSLFLACPQIPGAKKKKKKQTNNSVTWSISKVWSSGEGSGNPLQCSCLENARDGGAWWATVYGVAQSRPRLKRLSSSSSTINKSHISCVPVFIRQVSPFTLGLSLARPVLPFCVFYSIQGCVCCRLFLTVTLWTVTRQALLPMEFFKLVAICSSMGIFQSQGLNPHRLH